MSKEPDYSKCTDKEFDDALIRVMQSKSAEELIKIPGVYEAITEELNNEILDNWHKEKQVENKKKKVIDTNNDRGSFANICDYLLAKEEAGIVEI